MNHSGTIKNSAVLRLAVSGLLIAVGIVIPMFSPIKILLEPASFTLASHVAVFCAMFISPGMAVSVAAGTALGFFLGGFPLVVVLRAASHIVFAFCGAMYYRRENGMFSGLRLRAYSFFVAIAHALCEVIVVSLFYYLGGVGDAYYTRGFLVSVILLVGAGTVIHSLVDFELAVLIKSALQKQKSFGVLFR